MNQKSQKTVKPISVTVLVLFLGIALSCRKDDKSYHSVPYPINFDFKARSFQGHPLGWDFRLANFLGFKNEVIDSMLVVSHADSTKKVAFSYSIPGIYLSKTKISLSVEFTKKDPSFVDPVLTVRTSKGFNDGKNTKAKIDHISSTLVLQNLYIPEGTKDVLISIEIEGPNHIGLSPINFKVDGHSSAGFLEYREENDIANELREFVHPLGQTEASDGLKKLVQRINQARFVLIGESVHGADVFHKFKVDLTQSLIHNQKKVLVAMEDNMFAVQNLANTKELNAEVFKNAVFGVWESTHIYEFFKEKSSIGDSTILIAVDVQNPNHSIQYLRSMGHPKIDGKSLKFLDSVSQLITNKEIRKLEAGQINELLEGIKKIQISESILSQEELKYSQLAKIQLSRCIEFISKPSTNHRDQLMAENLKSLSQTFGEEYTIVYWGHDGHVRKNEGGTGGFLKEIVDDRVFSLSLQTLKGEHKAYGFFNGKLSWGNSTLIELPDGTLERLIWNSANNKDAFLIFDELPDHLTNAMDIWRPVRSIGAAATDFGLNSWKINGDVYDGVVVFERANPLEKPE